MTTLAEPIISSRNEHFKETTQNSTCAVNEFNQHIFGAFWIPPSAEKLICHLHYEFSCSGKYNLKQSQEDKTDAAIESAENLQFYEFCLCERYC